MNSNVVNSELFKEKMKPLKIALIGDIMLDCYYHGEVKRISPEAPVPVNRVLTEKNNIGGAGNVAANLALLGCEVHIAGFVGCDDNGKKLLNLLKEININSQGIICCDDRRTTTKLRVIGSNQQMLRLDFEEIKSLTEKEEAKLQIWFSELIKTGIDGLIISDYAKGVCTQTFCQWLIEQAHQNNIVVLVDPKGYNWEKYTGANIITPNVKEIGEAVVKTVANNFAEVVDASKEAIVKYGVEAILVTRSEKGATYVAKDKVFTTPSTAKEVFDVSGAGDTVAAVFLMAIANGFNQEQSAFLANEAASVVVSRMGTHAIRKEELLNHLVEKEKRSDRKNLPLNWPEIQKQVEFWKKNNEKIVFTNGCFDILHTGHVIYLEKAAELGDHLIIGLNTDKSVRTIKGNLRPLTSEIDRATILSALGCVDAVVLFDEETPEKLLELIRPDVLVKGGDYSLEDVIGKQYAGQVKLIDFEEGYSTTNIIDKITKLVKEGLL